MKNLLSLSGTQIIVGSTVGFALITFLVLQGIFLLFRQSQTTRLPELPEKPVNLIGASLPGSDSRLERGRDAETLTGSKRPFLA